jgi:transmembrane sensor
MSPRDEGSSAALDRWCEALDWYATLREADASDLTQAVGRDWQQWYAIPENRRVFDAVSRLMAASSLYRRRRRTAPAERRDDRYDLSLPIAEWRRVEANRPRTPRPRLPRAWWHKPRGLGLGAIALVLVLWSFRLDTSHRGEQPVTYETGPGGMKDVDLSDGSRVVLGQNTRLRVEYSRWHRSIALTRGRAWFNVKHEADWPFVVSAGHGTITDAGTAFSVVREPGRVLVTVMDGRVEVSARPLVWRRVQKDLGLLPGSSHTQLLVRGGEQLAIHDNGMLGRVTHAAAAASQGCACGRLIFNNKSLRHVTAVLSLYYSHRIFVDPEAGALRVSGIVFRDEIPQWLQSLEHSLPVKVQERGLDLRIRMRHPKLPRGS